MVAEQSDGRGLVVPRPAGEIGSAATMNMAGKRSSAVGRRHGNVEEAA